MQGIQRSLRSVREVQLFQNAANMFRHRSLPDNILIIHYKCADLVQDKLSFDQPVPVSTCADQT
jgi:hypothetical protein